MAILSLQRRLAEVGRIRLGQQVATKKGGKRPTALDTFRLTSADRARIDEAAKLYGGTVTKWEAPSGIPNWEVVTQADKLPVVVPPSAMAFSQHYELWSAGGCQRRCDGVTETVMQQGGQPCLCDPDSRQCDIHIRLSVMLRDLSGLGVWRVDTTGYYAALELQGAVEVIGLAAGRGQMLPATLRLDQRSIKREGEGVKKFAVPVLDIEISPAQLMMGTVAVNPGAPTRAALTPVPDSDVRPASIAEQVGAAEKIPSRRRAPAIPATNIRPRTAQQARSAGAGPPPATPPETEAVVDRSDEARELAAQDALEQTQDPPRMVTDAQLTKLGVLLTNRGFDRTAEGRAARLDFCEAAIRQLMPDSPYAGRHITTSKALTFLEAHKLIQLLEDDETKNEHGCAGGEPSEAPENDETGTENDSGEPPDNGASYPANENQGLPVPGQMDLLGNGK
jgi:hypothetical protein